MHQQQPMQTNNVNQYQGRVVLNGPPVPYVSPVAMRYRDRQSKGLGALMITLGLLCIIFNIVSIILCSSGYYRIGRVSFVGHGIWCGILFIITGSFGVSAARIKSKCMIITFMVMSIISSVLCTNLLAFGIIGALMATSQTYYQSCDYNDYGYYASSPYYHVPYCQDNRSMYNGVVAMEACLAIMAIIEAVLAIWASAICCRAVCCCSGQNNGIVYNVPPYSANGQVMFINQQQQSGQPLMTSYGGPPMYPGYPMQNQWGYTNVGIMVASDVPAYNPDMPPYNPTGAPPPMYDNPDGAAHNGPPPPFQEKQKSETLY